MKFLGMLSRPGMKYGHTLYPNPATYVFIEQFSFSNNGSNLCPSMLNSILGPYKNRNFINRSSRRKRGMASNPLFIIPDFFCIFPMNFAMATLGLKKMGKVLWEGREKGLPCWLSQFSKT